MKAEMNSHSPSTMLMARADECTSSRMRPSPATRSRPCFARGGTVARSRWSRGWIPSIGARSAAAGRARAPAGSPGVPPLHLGRERGRELLELLARQPALHLGVEPRLLVGLVQIPRLRQLLLR